MQPRRRAPIDLLTTIAIAALAASLTVGYHEGLHALACLAVGGDLHEYSAHHVDCTASDRTDERIVAGSASIGNLLLGAATFMLVVWLALRELGRIIGGTPDEQIGRAVRPAVRRGDVGGGRRAVAAAVDDAVVPRRLLRQAARAAARGPGALVVADHRPGCGDDIHPRLGPVAAILSIRLRKDSLGGADYIDNHQYR